MNFYNFGLQNFFVMPAKNELFKRSIKKFLYLENELSCADLSFLTQRSIPFIAKVLGELIEEGSIVESGLAHSTGGRRPQMYRLQKDIMYVVSVAMDQLITRIALVDMNKSFVGEVKRYDLVLANNIAALEELTDYISTFIDESKADKNKIAGIGIGMPGFVDVKKGINHSFLKNNTGQSITEYIEDTLNLPVIIDNDSSLIALAELKFGAAKNSLNAMVVNIGWGIGLGMIVKGEMFRGHNGMAGEFSHIPLFTNNKMCGCGKSGCLETETSLSIVIEKALSGIKNGSASTLKGIIPEDAEEAAQKIMEAAKSGDRFAVGLISEAGYNIGRGIAILIHLFNPELVILSGRGSLAGKVWLAPVQQAINEHCIPKISENTEVRISSLGYRAELIGAAALVMDHYDEARRESERAMVPA